MNGRPNGSGDTLVIVGGPAISRVDADEVHAASLRIAQAAAALAAASGACLAARGTLDRAVWTPTLDVVGDPARVGQLQWARSLAGDAADILGDRSRHCTSLSDRLLVAAGLYQHAETFVEQAVGAVVTGGSAFLGFAVSRSLVMPVTLLHAGVELFGAEDELWEVLTGPDGESGDHPAGPSGTGTSAPVGADEAPGVVGQMFGAVWRGVAPYADEVVAGAGVGVALGVPTVSRGDLSVTGGARVLSAAVDGLLPDLDVQVERVSADEFTVAEPAWSDQPARLVSEVVARLHDLYPEGSAVPDRDLPGTPPGTVAVQKIVDADGSVTWTVTIPGTQGLLAADHPFDGKTDLDLMAHETAEIMIGVDQALADAGAGPDEPVVLVGHSLGGIAAVGLAAAPWFRQRYTVGGVVTAGAPTATFRTPPGVPVLHVENTEELVSPLDGRSSEENPATVDRVTIGRRLADSTDPDDLAASGSVSDAHKVAVHLRTLQAAQDVGSVQAQAVTDRIELLLDGERAETRFYRVRRVPRDEG